MKKEKLTTYCWGFVGPLTLSSFCCASVDSKVALQAWGCKHTPNNTREAYGPCERADDYDPNSTAQGMANLLNSASSASSPTLVVGGFKFSEMNIASTESLPQIIDYNIFMAAQSKWTQK